MHPQLLNNKNRTCLLYYVRKTFAKTFFRWGDAYALMLFKFHSRYRRKWTNVTVVSWHCVYCSWKIVDTDTPTTWNVVCFIKYFFCHHPITYFHFRKWRRINRNREWVSKQEERKCGSDKDGERVRESETTVKTPEKFRIIP